MGKMDFECGNDMWMQSDMYKGMTDEERMRFGCLQLSGIVLAVILAMLVCAVFGSCGSVKYVMVPGGDNKTDTLLWYSNTHDSIYVHDSVAVRMMGDTVYCDRWHTKLKLRVERDTVYRSRVDSVAVPYPVETVKQVDKPLTRWQQMRMHMGDTLMIILLLIVVVWIVGKRLRRP